jgi:hypothetical protein
LRWALWDKGELRLSPLCSLSWKAAQGNARIGQNINQAVHAMNAASQPGSTLEVARIAALPRNLRRLKALLMEREGDLVLCRGESATGWTQKGRPMSFRLSSARRLHGWGLCTP